MASPTRSMARSWPLATSIAAGERDVEVAGQQVARARGDDPDGPGEQLGADLADGRRRRTRAPGRPRRSRRPRPSRCRDPRPSCSARPAPTSRTGTRVAPLDVVDLRRVHDGREARSRRDRLGEPRLGLLGVAVGRSNDSQQEDAGIAGGEQRAGGVVRARRKARSNPTTSASSTAAAYTVRRSMRTSMRGKHDRPPARAAELNAWPDGFNASFRHRVLAPSVGPGRDSLDAVVSDDVETITPTGEDGCPAVSEQRYGDQGRPDRHPDGATGSRCPAGRHAAGPARCPLLGRAAQVVDPVERGPLEVHPRASRKSAAHRCPGEGHSAGAVEHGRACREAEGGQPHPQRPTDV